MLPKFAPAQDIWIIRGTLAAQPAVGIFLPLVQMSEDAENIYLRALLPGLKQENLSLTVRGQRLSLTGCISHSKGAYRQQERLSGAFKRDLRLSVPVESEAVCASLQNGVLKAILPKAGGTGRLSIPVICEGDLPNE